MSDDDELAQRAEARVGTTLRDKYRIDGVLGVGGMAVVYRATHKNQAKFAIKMLHPELSVRESLRKRFLREGYAANSVKHPGVVAVVDEDVAEDGAAFLVMELLEGASLEAVAARYDDHVPVSLACSVLDQLLDVLVVAHAAGIVHRDLKPSNLFVSDDGALKVLDFGIARVRDGLTDGKDATATGVLLGTPSFMAPEQARGKSSEIDARTDLWAAAATFFTLVSGETVHQGTNSAQMIIASATSFPRSIRTVAPQLHEALARVIDRALSFDRTARWESATEMRDALHAASIEALGALPSRVHVSIDVPAIASARTVAVANTTTSSSVDKTTVTPPRRSLVLQIVAAGAVVATAGTLFVVTRHGDEHVEPSAVTATAATVTTSAPVIATSSPIVEARTSAPSPSASAPRPQPSSARPVRRQPSCIPPYYFDAEGKKIFRTECL